MAVPTTRTPGLPAETDRAMLRSAAQRIRNTQPVEAYDLHRIADQVDTSRPIAAQRGLSFTLATARAIVDGRLQPAPEPRPRPEAPPHSGTLPWSAVLLADAAIVEHAVELTPRRWAMVLRIRALAKYVEAEEQRLKAGFRAGVQDTVAHTHVRLLREHADLVEARNDLTLPMPAEIADLASRVRGRTR